MSKEAEEKAIASFDTLTKIVEQLEWCEYECMAGKLINNIAFISLKRMAESEENKND